MIEGHMMPDPIHLLVEIAPKMSVSQLLKRKKCHDDIQWSCKSEV